MRWDSRWGEVFPEYRAQMKGNWAHMTLEQFLSHRSGTPENLDNDGLWHQLWQRKGSPRQQRLQLLQGVIKRPPLFSPGSQFLYSNAGFALAGAMAEKVTGQPWETPMTTRIFKPLGMVSAGFGPPGSLNKLNQPWGAQTRRHPRSPRSKWRQSPRNRAFRQCTCHVKRLGQIRPPTFAGRTKGVGDQWQTSLVCTQLSKITHPSGCC